MRGDGTLRIEHRAESTWGKLVTGGFRIEANVAVTVPEGLPVRIETVSADVFVAGTRSESTVTTVSGRVTGTALAGETVLRTVSGDVEAQDLSGEVLLQTVSGDLTLAGDPTDVTVRSVSGDVTLDLGTVRDLSCTTVSGDVAVRLPADGGLRLDVLTVSGRLETTFPDRDLDGGAHRLQGRIGSGRREVKVRTTSGDVTLLRRSEATADR